METLKGRLVYKGERGYSAYEIAVQNGYEGTKEEWLTSLGVQGPAGPSGPTGPSGNDGADGLGVPAGGTSGQILTKQSATDNDTAWVSPDDTLNVNSANPIQNKTVTQAINKINTIFYNEEGEWTLDEDYEESE